MIPQARPLAQPASENPIPSSSSANHITQWRSQVSPPPHLSSGPRTEAGTDSELISLQSSPKGRVQAMTAGSAVAGMANQSESWEVGRRVERSAMRQSSVDSFAGDDDDLAIAMGIHMGEEIQEDDSFAGSPLKQRRTVDPPRKVTPSVATIEDHDYDMNIAAEMELQDAQQAAVQQSDTARPQWETPSRSSKGKGRAGPKDSVVDVADHATGAGTFGEVDSMAGPSHPLVRDNLRSNFSPQKTPPQQQPVFGLGNSSSSRHPPAKLASRIVAAPTTEVVYPWSKEVAKRLKGVFGLQGFRMNQKDIIDATMGGKDGGWHQKARERFEITDSSNFKVFVLMPTGGGKSLCCA